MKDYERRLAILTDMMKNLVSSKITLKILRKNIDTHSITSLIYENFSRSNEIMEK